MAPPELISASKCASNHVLNIEDMTEDELKMLKKFYGRLSDLSEKEDLGASRSIDVAQKNNFFKEQSYNDGTKLQ